MLKLKKKLKRKPKPKTFHLHNCSKNHRRAERVRPAGVGAGREHCEGGLQGRELANAIRKRIMKFLLRYLGMHVGLNYDIKCTDLYLRGLKS